MRTRGRLAAVLGFVLAFGLTGYRMLDAIPESATPSTAAQVRPAQDSPADNAEWITGPEFVIVPMDDVSAPMVARVARRLGRAYDIRVRLAPRMPSEEAALDRGRGQLVGDRLVSQLWRHYRARHRGAAVIGVTNGDLYWDDNPGWRFAFGVIHDSGYGALSTARMDPRNLGAKPDERTLERRLTAMMGRYLARLSLDLQPASGNPRSALRESVLEVADLDEMTPWVCPDDPALRRPC